MRRKALTAAALCLACAAGALAQSGTLEPGTSIPVRTNETIDVRNSSDGRVFTGVVDRDVLDRNGNVAIPRGSNAELMVRNTGRRDLSVDLDSVMVNGRRYSVVTNDVSQSGNRKDGIGKNGRTAKYVGGGALLGTIIGAIAGGGKGAAIGAAAGGAAGAGTEVMTKGGQVRVPAESILTFQLDRPLTVDVQDRGYDRGGHHYHYSDR